MSEWPRDRLMETSERICNPAAIAGWLETGEGATVEAVREILLKAAAGRGLAPAEAAVLIQVSDPRLRQEVLETARQLHRKQYGGRINLMAPVCPNNRCVNECLYCPLRRSNSHLQRKMSTTRDLQREVLGLLDEGYRHLTLVFGDDRSGLPYIRDMVWAAHGARTGIRQIQRVDINVNALRLEELQDLREASRLGTYHVYQDTYDPEVYRELHPAGPKSDYEKRLTCHDLAAEAGFTNLGLGVLLGLADFRFEIPALIAHVEHLERTYAVAPHAVSFPRMIAAPHAPASQTPERQVSDDDFCFIVAVTRLARPRADIILSTPAPSEVRRELYALGISSVSVGSLSYPGVYTSDGDPSAAGTLNIGRPRALETLVYRMCEVGFVPNFCASCYPVSESPSKPEQRLARTCTNERCSANALLAFKEYLLDHASPETQTLGEQVLQRELARLPEDVRNLTLDLLEEIEAGMRRPTL
ncbi:MAG: [FeFe] hydrogenase H-cluster radical SAM maturase HydG [Armatimonadia bacterium]